MSLGSFENPLTVSAVTIGIKQTLNELFGQVWVTGEVSGVSYPKSGHIYFSLKDSEALMSAVMWRGVAARTKFQLEDGMEVICTGDVDVYPPRGSYQLIVREIMPKGAGALQLALKQLHDKLAKEGLFSHDRKRPLPRFPKHIGFVTSPTGAAIRDFVEVATRRWPRIRISIFPTKVQGEGAAAEIAAAIAKANSLLESERPDVLVVGRGGGSVEDLWSFNEEVVVRAMSKSAIPTVSAVGHEIDTSLSDLVADLRAATPTEAAERIVPNLTDLTIRLRSIESTLSQSLKESVLIARERLAKLEQRRIFQHPTDWINQKLIAVDEKGARLRRAGERQLAIQQQKVERIAGRLENLSPLKTLARGYSLTSMASSNPSNKTDSAPLSDSASVEIGDIIRTRLAKGELISRVEKKSS